MQIWEELSGKVPLEHCDELTQLLPWRNRVEQLVQFVLASEHDRQVESHWRHSRLFEVELPPNVPSGHCDKFTQVPLLATRYCPEVHVRQAEALEHWPQGERQEEQELLRLSG